MNLVEIGQRIKQNRKTCGLSQEKLAEYISVTPHYIYEIERGMKAMSLETLINLSDTLKLSTDYILFGTKKDYSEGLYDKLEELSDDKRQRAENAFLAILPYIQ